MISLMRATPVRVIDAFVDALDLAEMSFEGSDWSALVPSLGSPEALHLRQSESVQSSRRLEREAGRN